MALARIKLGLAAKLKNEDYFQKFFAERTKDELASQIREYREDVRGLTQAEFAAECGMKQSAVSRIEDADYSGWNFKTLLRVAKGLKARLVIRFELMEHVIQRYENRQFYAGAANTGAPTSLTFDGHSVGLPRETGETKIYWKGAATHDHLGEQGIQSSGRVLSAESGGAKKVTADDPDKAQGGKPGASKHSADSGGNESQHQRWSREKYNAYQRDYMRKRRAR